MTRAPLDFGVAQVDMQLSLREDIAGLSGYLEFALELFDRSTAEKLVARFIRVLEQVVAAPGS